ncbi:MAG TPA: transposase [Streptosporangiaceae bacterium]|nr:transposase [Streptosporangiaceae bacterium]
MFVRYRYRAYPTAGQAEMLARTFGCARVVFNDALRLRDAAHEAGEKISGTEVQRRVVTLAKATPEREWLSGVASVALVQACQDARRAYRNWFDSMSGKRKGRRVGHPRFRPPQTARSSRTRPSCGQKNGTLPGHSERCAARRGQRTGRKPGIA